MAVTPMMRQYYEIKMAHEDAILFFRLGDFYEMFYEDAYKASRLLGLTLTSRGKDEHDNKIPMCGIPYHAANNYIPKLLAQNISIAICEQVEEATAGKGLTRREVINVITPGTLIEDNYLQSDENNFLLAVCKDPQRDIYGIAYVDISTGEFWVTTAPSKETLLDEVEKVGAREVLVPSGIEPQLFKEMHTVYVNAIGHKEAEQQIKAVFGLISLESIGIEGLAPTWPAIVSITDYLVRTKKSLKSIQKPRYYDPSSTMGVNAATLRHLEILQPLNNQGKAGSLLWTMDKTETPMGARLMRKWLLRPLYDIIEIRTRHDVVDYLYQHQTQARQIMKVLDNVFDLERLGIKINNRNANPKDLISLRTSLHELPDLLQLLASLNENAKALVCFPQEWIPVLNTITTLIETTLTDDPPALLNQGGFVRRGVDEELDQLFNDVTNNRQWIIDMEARLREETGIKNLKINYNRVFGYYLEVTTSQLDKVPSHFIRKQTLANAERYYTEELKAKEDFILHADEIILKKELALYDSLLEKLVPYTPLIQTLADKLAILDCLCAFARVAHEKSYVRPDFNDQGRLYIKNARHPVVEQNMNGKPFIPNDIYLDKDSVNFILLTGPNMAGKSTYMRQIAILVIMAQTGSFIPAEAADLCLIDRLFTRIGASDNLFEGKSTFMVEMLESANILHNATSKSLIIMDEIGRGTSTFDGLSLAAAIAKYIYSTIKAKTLFATHYHEMTTLTATHPMMKNANVAILEEGNKIRFTYKVVPGKAEKSYGIHVADIAGIPQQVLDDANRILEGLEQEQISLYEGKQEKAKQLSFF